MTLTEWFKINPNHKALISGDASGVRVTLHGGDGVDQRIVGKGADEVEAIANALEVRDQICAQLRLNL